MGRINVLVVDDSVVIRRLVTTVLEGAIDFVVAGTPVHLTAGQLAALPGGTPHSATTPQPGAVTLNVFTHRDAPPDA